MFDDRLRIHRRHLPPLATPRCDLRRHHGKFYDLLAVVVMPDHAQEIIQPIEGHDLPRIMKGTKGVSARLVNGTRGTTGTLWQDESFDRIIRDEPGLAEKLAYMVGNPVKAGLVEDPGDYPALYVKPGSG